MGVTKQGPMGHSSAQSITHSKPHLSTGMPSLRPSSCSSAFSPILSWISSLCWKPSKGCGSVLIHPLYRWENSGRSSYFEVTFLFYSVTNSAEASRSCGSDGEALKMMPPKWRCLNLLATFDNTGKGKTTPNPKE